MKTRPIEDMLNDQLAACTAATQDCLAQSRLAAEDAPLRQADLDYVAKLVKASARLAEALARLRGHTRHRIQVTHAGSRTGKKGV